MNFFELFPSEVVKAARASGSDSIAYTYSEPISFYEYMFDTANMAKKSGVANLMITNGYINADPLNRLCTVIDGATAISYTTVAADSGSWLRLEVTPVDSKGLAGSPALSEAVGVGTGG